MSASAAAVAVEGLTRRFGEVTAVDQVSFAVQRGEIFGVLGPDGAGKTTLMRLLAGIMLPDGGSAEVAGHDVVKDPEGVKRRIGYLSQRFSLYTDLTISGNIDFVAQLYQAPREQAERLKTEMLEMTGLAPFAKRQAGRLSGGMKQKLALTCALVHRPEVLLLDEPTTGVDPISRRDFHRILAALPDQGVTVVLSSPYMDEAARCHRLALMGEGRILASGTAAELGESVVGTMLEVVTTEVRRAAALLAPAPEVLQLTPFGDSLHVTVAAGTAAVECVTALLGAGGLTGVPVNVIAPSLEDAFVSLLARRPEEAPA